MEEKRPTALIVEDDPATAASIDVALATLMPDLKVRLVSSAATALHFLEGRRPDLVILDYRLPDMTGLELAVHVRKHSADTPILLMSAMRDPDLPERAKEAGVNEFLAKPFDGDDLLRAIERLMAII